MTEAVFTAVRGIGEIRPGDDLASVFAEALAPHEPRDGDIVVVTSKVVSKAEGRGRPADQREAAITEESVRLVASRTHAGGVTRIVEHRSGVVLAAAGVGASNVDRGEVLLLPLDADASARDIASRLRDTFGVRIGVIVSDTLGRPWRIGQTDAAIGAAGVKVITRLAGQLDTAGRELTVTAPAVADEIAAGADLVAGKTAGVPAVLVRGLANLVGDLDEPGAAALVRQAGDDMFRLGTDEAYQMGRAAGRIEGRAERGGVP